MKIGQKPSWSNPTPGAVIDVPAGESVELLFTCNNDQQKVVTFVLEASGLGSWAEERTSHAVAPFDTSNLPFTVLPKPTAELGDYPFTVRLTCGGDLVEPLGERALVLRVTEGAPVVEEPPPVQPPAETVQVADIAPEKPKAERKPAAPKIAATPPPLAAEAGPPVVDEPLPPVVEDPQPEPEPEEEPEEAKASIPPGTRASNSPGSDQDGGDPAGAEVAQASNMPGTQASSPPGSDQDGRDPAEPIVAPAPSPPDPEPAEPPGMRASSSTESDQDGRAPREPVFYHEPEPEIVYVEEPKPKADPVPVSRPEPKVVKVVDLEQTKAEVAWEDEEEEQLLQIQADSTIANPKEGTSIYARPGEKVLVRFSIKNDQSGVRTYVIQEDRALPIDWIALVQDQVNITPGGTGDVSVMLTPPLNAEPATYPFTVSYGILGQPLAPTYLQLCVQAAPAVKLRAKATAASVWVPFNRALDYQLTVESQGNADTAYRISVKDPLAERDEQGRPKGPDDLYETPTWRYLFDRELDTLTSPSANRPPTPEQHRFKLVRKGIWWFGWIERHKMTLAARPVTDGANGGKGENVVELSGRRWRLFPAPAFIALPLLLLLFVMLGSGADNLRVNNALYGDDGNYYVPGTATNQTDFPVHLSWNAPIYAVLKGTKIAGESTKPLPINHTDASDNVTVQDYGQAQNVTYEVGSKFSWASEKAKVRFVPIRTSGQLSLTDGAGLPVNGTAKREDKIGVEMVSIRGRDITITVPKTGNYRLNLDNLTGRGKVLGQQIVMWTLHAPEGFEIQNFVYTGQNNNQIINPGAAIHAIIKVTSINDVPADGAEWDLLTTDEFFQHLIIHLKVGD